MKKTDIAMIVLVAALSIMFSYMVVGAIPVIKLSDNEKKSVLVESIEKYDSVITKPDPTIFNKDAINPTVDITIGGDSPDKQ